MVREVARMNPRSLLLFFVASSLILVGCGKDVTQPESLCSPRLILQAPTGVMQDVATVTVRVTGPDMDAVTKSLTISGNQATGTVRVPAGENRTFTVEAKDANNEVLATGNTTRDLEAGTSPTVTVTLNIPSHDIVGFWGHPYDGGTEYFQFWEDNAYEYQDWDDFGDLINYDSGTYSTSGDQLTLNSDWGFGWPVWTYSVTDGGNTLTLSYQGNSYVFTRITS
jgi:hypothetical protein